MDGTGYPNGAKGDEIPLLGRVLHTADAFVAMTSPRPHQKDMSQEEVLVVMRRLTGTDFDPDTVDALGRVIGGTQSLRLVAG
jgi:putative two-component system response regulator